MAPFEFFEHTADIGLKISGKNFQELLTHGADGLLEVMTNASEARFPVDPETRVTVQLAAADGGDMLLKWLREILFYFSSKRFVLKHYEFETVSETALKAQLSGWKFDTKHFDQRVEVKAVTYHALEIRKMPGGWTAQVILDI
jgi:SHS2 domain-containing protein